MKRRLLFAIFLAALLGLAAKRHQALDAVLRFTRPPLPPAQMATNVAADRRTPGTTNMNAAVAGAPEPQSAASLPAESNLAVPFTSQAPFANWELPYQEACEEAAALMVRRFWTSNPFDSKKEADEAILKVVAFEEKEYGSYKDTTADETARFIRDLWGYTRVDVVSGTGVTLERIKREVADGYPVIVLAAGRLLGNPNFRRPGPVYHALVIKGYTKSGAIITNDPGTRKGTDYLYDPVVLMNAIHDWNGGDVEHGQKVMIVVRP